MPAPKPARRQVTEPKSQDQISDHDRYTGLEQDNVSQIRAPGAPIGTNFDEIRLDELYNWQMLHPDGGLYSLLISYGLTESQAEQLMPEASMLLGKLCSEFQNVASTRALDNDLPHELPVEAPEKFVVSKGRPKKGADIVSFLRRVWKPWIDAGLLSRTELKRLDPAAHGALISYLARHELPEDVNILKLSAVHDKLVPDAFKAFLAAADERTVRAVRAIAERYLKNMRELDI